MRADLLEQRQLEMRERSGQTCKAVLRTGRRCKRPAVGSLEQFADQTLDPEYCGQHIWTYRGVRTGGEPVKIREARADYMRAYRVKHPPQPSADQILAREQRNAIRLAKVAEHERVRAAREMANYLHLLAEQEDRTRRHNAEQAQKHAEELLLAAAKPDGTRCVIKACAFPAVLGGECRRHAHENRRHYRATG